jgi:hypothetical protein
MLSDQPIPNLLSIHALRPDHLVLIATPQMKERRKDAHLLEALKLSGADYTQRHDIVEVARQESLADVVGALRKAYGMHPSAVWKVNITGGTKIMSIAAYEFFKAMGASIYYVEISRPDVLLCLSDGKQIPCDHPLSCKEFFRAYGFKCDDTWESEKRAERLFPIAQAIAADPEAFRVEMNDDERKLLREGKLTVETGKIQLQGPRLMEEFSKEAESRQKSSELGFASFRLINEQDNVGFVTGRIDKYTGQFLSGGWLECFFYILLKRQSRPLGLSDVRLGIKPAPVDAQSSGNDLDVAFIRNHALSVIECKTGMGHDPSFEALYKLEAVLEQSRALLRKSYFVTTDIRIYDPQVPEQPRPHLARRAKIYNCTLILPHAFQSLAQEQDPERLRGMIMDILK